MASSASVSCVWFFSSSSSSRRRRGRLMELPSFLSSVVVRLAGRAAPPTRAWERPSWAWAAPPRSRASGRAVLLEARSSRDPKSGQSSTCWPSTARAETPAMRPSRAGGSSSPGRHRRSTRPWRWRRRPSRWSRCSCGRGGGEDPRAVDGAGALEGRLLGEALSTGRSAFCATYLMPESDERGLDVAALLGALLSAHAHQNAADCKPTFFFFMNLKRSSGRARLSA